MNRYTLSLMKICMNMYYDNRTNLLNIKVMGQE